MEAQFYQSVFEASFAFGVLKISIALSLLRLSKGSWYHRILWALIGMTICLRLTHAAGNFVHKAKSSPDKS
jgi:hypothetical protein